MDFEKTVEQVREIVGKTQGNRHIVVLDRGWIFAGELSQDEQGMYRLTQAVNVRRWKQNGFGGLTKSATASGAELDPCDPITFSASAMILAVPIGGDWDA